MSIQVSPGSFFKVANARATKSSKLFLANETDQNRVKALAKGDVFRVEKELSDSENVYISLGYNKSIIDIVRISDIVERCILIGDTLDEVKFELSLVNPWFFHVKFEHKVDLSIIAARVNEHDLINDEPTRKSFVDIMARNVRNKTAGWENGLKMCDVLNVSLKQLRSLYGSDEPNTHGNTAHDIAMIKMLKSIKILSLNNNMSVIATTTDFNKSLGSEAVKALFRTNFTTECNYYIQKRIDDAVTLSSGLCGKKSEADFTERLIEHVVLDKLPMGISPGADKVITNIKHVYKNYAAGMMYSDE